MARLGLDQILQCAQELSVYLEGDDRETKILQNVQNISNQLVALYYKRQGLIRQDLQYFTIQAGNDISISGKIGSFEDVMSIENALQEKIIAKREQSASLNIECQKLKEELAKAETEEHCHQEQRKRLKDARVTTLPKARCEVNLYSNITRLRWQFQCEPNEIKGYICNNKDVKTFNLNSQQVSRYFIANYLWDMIEEDW